MKIKLSTVYGSHEKYDVEITKVSLDKNGLDEREALENGWLIHDNQWYHSRSTRIRLSQVKPRLPNIYGVSFEVEPYDKEAFDRIYDDFVNYKKFTKRYDYSTDFSRSAWLVARDHGEPVAFTKFTRYTGGIESAFTAWNYHRPKISLGTNIMYYEMEYARAIDLEFLYIGSGYGESAKYKSMAQGFEWWTGEEWSTDRKLYLDLCERDATVNSLHDLSNVLNAPSST